MSGIWRGVLMMGWVAIFILLIRLTRILYQRHCFPTREDTNTDEARLAQLIRLKWLREELAATEEHIRVLSKTMEARKRRRPPVTIPTQSDVFCQGHSRRERTCRFKNICMDVRRRQFFILRSSSSQLFNVPPTVPADFLDLTTVDDHNVFFWTFGEAPADFFTGQSSYLQLRTLDLSRPDSPRLRARMAKESDTLSRLTIVRGATYLTKRFYPRNIMHVLHDDWLGLFHLRSLWPSLADDDDDDDNNNNVHTALVTFDGYPGEQDYDETYDWLANYYRIEDLLTTEPERGPGGGEEEGEGEGGEDSTLTQYICWQDAVVGNHKELSWYQYGYGRPQGPIEGHKVTGFHLREAANFIFRRLALETWDENLIQRTIDRVRRNMLGANRMNGSLEDPCISIFSRRRNRLILNEDELGTSLQSAFDLPICWVRLEDEPLSNLVVHLRRSVAAFGMHGAILILALFLPPGAVLVEGFPWGVPPENYTPYATMARLSGMRLAYRAWTPSQATSCVGHPGRPRIEGGIAHLPQEQQEFILKATTIPPHACCDNPHWLYRIFQDTTVDAKAIIRLVREGWAELSSERVNGGGGDERLESYIGDTEHGQGKVY